MARTYSSKYVGRIALVAMALAALAVTTPLRADAADVEVKILTSGNDGESNVFDPEIVRIKPGDSVHFIAVGKGHNVQSIKSMMPEDAASFRGSISQDYIVKFDKAGIYGYYCLPHFAMGMVGLVVVGTPTNEEAAKVGMNTGVPERAKIKFTKLFTMLDGTKNTH